MFDPRIARFFALDPDTDKYPQWSPYLFAANNPIIYIDENGEGPEPLTTAGLKVLANSLGIYGNKRIGELFERIAVKAIQSKFIVVHNITLNFESQVRAARNGGKPSAVRPDAIGLTKRVGGIVDIQGDKNSFYEAKATSATITRSYRQGQIEGMVDVLATRMSSSSVKIATLTLLTTSDTKISSDILDYATKRGVSIYQSIAAIDENNNIYFSDLKRLNNVPGKDHTLENFLKAIDLDDYDTFSPQNPRSHSEGFEKKINVPQGVIGNVNSDPDPAQVEDK